jgi:chromosome segregation ATPase
MTMNELKQQRATLITERETLENSLPSLDTAWRNAPSNYSPIGNVIGSPEKSEAMDRYSSTECRLRAIPAELDRIDQKLTYLERKAHVGQMKTESIHAMSEATKEIEALGRTQAHLRERLEAIQSEAEYALGKAQQAERDAARLYAISLANGDTEGEKNANNEIQKAAKQLATTDEQVRRQELIQAALRTELDTIANQISNAQKRKDDAKKAALDSIGFSLDEEWNEATKHLIAIGARIVAVSYQKGGMGDALSSLKVPRFGPFLSKLDRSELASAANSISLTDLLAE